MIVKGNVINTKQQKIVRYYISNEGGKLVKCHNDGREIQVESGEWLQTVVNKLDVGVSFNSYDINKKYYLEEDELKLQLLFLFGIFTQDQK